MHKLTIKRIINASAGKVWRTIDDFGKIYRFNPEVEFSSIINGVETGLGAERQCIFYNGAVLKERITKYVEGESMNIEIFDAGNFPVKKSFAIFKVKPHGTGKTDVEIIFSFVPKYGPIGWLMAKILMKPQFRKILNEVLIGLESHLTTGKIVGKNGVLIEAAAV